MSSSPRRDSFATSVVVPCYNEAERLDVGSFSEFLTRHPDFSFLFVDDGSVDGTIEVLELLRRRHPDQCELLHFAANQGKAEAVRRGMIQAYSCRPDALGYFDADLATPLETLPRMVEALRRRPATNLVMGARVRLQGHRIERKWSRQILGSSFARVASWTLGFPVVDTQCGAKLFRAVPQVGALFASPFRSRWIFDVEILARLHQQDAGHAVAEQLYELPLESWREVPGSKLKPRDFLKAIGELLGNAWRYRLRPHGPRDATTAAEQPTLVLPPQRDRPRYAPRGPTALPESREKTVERRRAA